MTAGPAGVEGAGAGGGVTGPDDHDDGGAPLPLSELDRCFEGAIPAVVATASASGTPNVTYLSRVRRVDDERVALSNQFFSKTARNLAENPRACVLLIDPLTYDEFRLELAYERTERRGPVFERLRDDVDLVAALSGMQDVFRLRAADIYRVLDVRPVRPRVDDAPAPVDRTRGLVELSARLARCQDLDALVDAVGTGLDELLGYRHSVLMLLAEDGRSLYTIASHGYPDQGVGSEVAIGEGVAGLAAQRGTTVRVGDIRQMDRYGRSVRESFEEHGVHAEREIRLPLLAHAESQLAAPALALGQLVGVLLVERLERVGFDESDEQLLALVAAQVAAAIEADRAGARDPGAAPSAPVAAAPAVDELHVRFFPGDGSTFLDGEYLIKGVAGRILWSLLGQFDQDGRVDFTNREVRLDPTLELPEYRDNLESRLILLKRRLQDRDAPIRLEGTGRGRFRLLVDATLRLESMDAPGK